MSEATVKIKFNRDYTTNSKFGCPLCDGVEQESFEKGKVYSRTPASAEHFVKRGIADLVESKAK